ncbi:MAG: hypothetical protein IPL46_29125 [Saprospiraceae bacterium]|nr:hypothetical protein [Saprospiraceae bacterium]
MRIGNQVNILEVWRNWGNHPEGRRMILNPLLSFGDLKWYDGKIEEKDLKQMYIISSNDWTEDGLCESSFLLEEVVKSLENCNQLNDKILDIMNKVECMKSNLSSINTKLIIVAPNLNGPFTIIEGNRRAVALRHLSRIVNLNIYLGISQQIRNYPWANRSFPNSNNSNNSNNPIIATTEGPLFQALL